MGPFQGFFSGTFMEEWRGYSYHISVFLLLRKHCFGRHTETPALTHICKHTPAFPSLTQTSESSAFLVPAISSIFSQQTGSHYKHLAVISHIGSRKQCNTHCKGSVQKNSIKHLQFWNKYTLPKFYRTCNTVIGNCFQNCSCKNIFD